MTTEHKFLPQKSLINLLLQITESHSCLTRYGCESQFSVSNSNDAAGSSVSVSHVQAPALFSCNMGESIAVDLHKKRRARPFHFQIMILHCCCGMYCLRNACLVSCSYPAWRNIVCYSFKYPVIHRGGLQSKWNYMQELDFRNLNSILSHWNCGKVLGPTGCGRLNFIDRCLISYNQVVVQVIQEHWKKMRGAVFAALTATMGNLLQGWDNATIAGAVLYIKKEFELETRPTIEGLILAMSLIGATVITTFSGPVSDMLGRRPMLIISSVLYFLSGLVMFWSPNVYILLFGRLLDGFGVGLAVTLVPIYISETAPSEIRGQLNTLPQFTGSGGMFLSYCMVFGMSLMDSPSWRLMLGVLSLPSLAYLALTVFYMPESPRWLVSKGRMAEAKQVLQRLRGREDVTGEMALLVEGLSSGGDTSIQEYVIGAENEESPLDKNQVRLYGPEQGQSWIARPVASQSSLAMASRYGSVAHQRTALMDPLVQLFGSVHENLPQTGSMRSMLFPNFGSMFNNGDDHTKNENWDAESSYRHGGGPEDYASDDGTADADENLTSPLLSRRTSAMERDGHPTPSGGSTLNMGRNSSQFQPNGTDMVNSTDIGGGWQLAWKYTEKGERGKGEGELKRMFLKQEGAVASRHGSILSMPGGDVSEEGQLVQAAALVSQSVLHVKDAKGQPQIEPDMFKPSAAVTRRASWMELFEPGVKHALIVGMGLQILQQFSGINGVLYYTPQILEQAGVEVLLSNIGIGSDSASLLISALTTLLMLPAIAVAMRLMDISGRRFLLLNTLPVLIASLIVLVISNVIEMGAVLHAIFSTVSVVVYFCSFVMGFGPVPNILCSEIFPTRVRGLCIAVCSLTFWIGDIIVTYSLPGLLSSIGLAGVFGIYTIVCTIAWFFVFLKVPETKGMPLEVISEFFNVGARQAASATED